MNNMKPTKGYRAFQVINTIIMILVIFITLYPFVYLVAQSFSSDAAASAIKRQTVTLRFILEYFPAP